MAKSILKKSAETAPSTKNGAAPKSRKRAADMFDDPPENEKVESAKPVKKVKTSKTDGKAKKSTKTPPVDDDGNVAEPPRKKTKEDKKEKKHEKEEKKEKKAGKTKGERTNSDDKSAKRTKSSSEPAAFEPFDDDDEDGLDSSPIGQEEVAKLQEEVLLAGFSDSGDEEEDGKGTTGTGFSPGTPLPKIERTKELEKKLLKASKANDGGEEGPPGVIYVGRVPHGFYEHEMHGYFSQFGTVEHVRLSRSKKTGGSKHYAFLQFASEEVAKIAASAMNNYLLFGHILKCHFVPKEQVHENLWVGADKRFKKVPWNKIEGRKLQLGKSRSEWEKKVEKTRKAREEKMKKLKAIGYEFEAPELKSVDSVPVKEPETLAIAANGDERVIAVTEVVTEKPKKEKKKKKLEGSTAKAEDADHGVVVEEPVNSVVVKETKVKKKSKKSKV